MMKEKESKLPHFLAMQCDGQMVLPRAPDSSASRAPDQIQGVQV